jgi:hypothetical protein
MTSDAEMLAACQPVAGWMHDDELRWLAAQARSCRTIVEIGVWQGKSTLALALNTPGCVYAIDHWRGAPDEIDTHQRQASTSEGRGELFSRAMANLWPVIEWGRCLPLALPSADAADLLGLHLMRRGGIDLLFVDGSHRYEDAKRDLEVWLQLVARGGLVCGHDRDHAGVRQAVGEVLGPVTSEPGSLWSKRL